jgi:E3 ubiquitin-protein ligase HERC4
VKKPAEAFIFGFKSLIRAKGLSMLKAQELKILVEGTPIIDVEDIAKYTRNSEAIDSASSTFFWECFKKQSQEDRATLLMFWTGSDKMPVEGAKLLRLSLGRPSKPYFVAHVCPKVLDVPTAKNS